MNQVLSQKIKILSLLAMIAVVFLHASTAAPVMQFPGSIIEGSVGLSSFVQYFVANGITRFCIPLFFAISGYLFFLGVEGFSVGAYLNKLGRRVRTLALPFVLWTLIAYVLSRLFLEIDFFKGAVAYPDKGLNLEGFLLLFQYIYFTPVAPQLWFIWHLMAMVLLSLPLYFILRTFLGYVVVAAGLYVFIWQVTVPFFLPSYLAQEAVLFFSLGGMFALHKFDMSYRLKPIVVVSLFVVWITLLVVKTFLSYEYALPYFHQVLVILGLVVVWFGYDELCSREKLKAIMLRLSEHTFFIYVFHLPIMTIMLNSVLSKLGGSPAVSLVLFVVFPVVVICVSVVLGALMSRFVPNVYAVLTGGRGAKGKSKG
ncbi:MAG: hypothetical protein COA42_08135 [Alteromonadaceae bacterium]|nr:MAG: hypothetical protein COA42_08135 [Alteromonadaceae bacterium]